MLSTADLDRIAESIHTGPYEGYPALDQRLYATSPGFSADGETVVIPDGPWHVHHHVNRHGVAPQLMDPEVPEERPAAADELARGWRAEGLSLDQHGRPLHPFWRQLLADPRIGMPTGAGFFYRYGPNATVDPVVYRFDTAGQVEFLLIKRLHGGRWALPGGFRDRTDASAEATARREAAEETGLDAIGGTAETVLHAVPVNPRETLHAWAENTVVLIHGHQEYLHDAQPVPGDDAIDVGWFTMPRIGDLDLLHGHAAYIDTIARGLSAPGRP